MVCKQCPVRKHCWDKGNCQDCEFGKAYIGLTKKIERLRQKNEALEKANKEMQNRIDTLTNPNF